VQLNESHTPEEGTGYLKNAEYPEGKAAHTVCTSFDGRIATLRRHHICLSWNRHRRVIVSPGSGQRELSAQEHFLALAGSLQGTRDALTCDGLETDMVAALRTALTRFGFSLEQLTTLLTTNVCPPAETEEQKNSRG
jgi:hypothetical protein